MKEIPGPAFSLPHQHTLVFSTGTQEVAGGVPGKAEEEEVEGEVEEEQGAADTGT